MYIKEKNSKIKLQDITLIGMIVAVIEVCKFALAGIPNIELTTFLLIMFTISFGKKIAFVVPVFILLEGFIYGFGMWWIMYLYTWPSLVIIAWLFRKNESVLFWSILSAIYGLLFGFFCSIPYYFIGMVDGGIRNGLYAGFTWWIAGIPWDILHCVGNFCIMLILYKPMRFVLKRY